MSHDERVSDEWIANEVAYSDRDGCHCEYCLCLRELIERRKADKYVQHLPGCDLGKWLNISWCPNCGLKPAGVIRVSISEVDKCVCGGQIHYGNYKSTICTCGLSELPEYIRNGGK